MNSAYLIDGARTAFGGSLATIDATELGAATAVEALKRSNVKAEDINHVFYGNVIQSSVNGAYLARHNGLFGCC